MKAYFVRKQNFSGNCRSTEYKTLHDAEIAVDEIKKVNSFLDKEIQIHGWVTEWNGYALKDGSKVTESARMILEF